MAKYPKPDLEKREDRGGVYYFRYYHPVIKADGKKGYIRPNLSTGLKDKEEALRYAKEAIKDAIDKGPAKEPVQTSVAVLEGSNLVDRTNKYLSMRYHGKKAKTTIVSVSANLRYMIEYSPTKLRDKITPEVADDIYAKYRMRINKINKTPSERSAYHFLTDVCAYWDWEVMLRAEVLYNPFAHIPKPKSDDFVKTEETWDPGEYEIIRDGLEGEYQDFFVGLRYSAMYPKDLLMTQKVHVMAKDGLGIMKRRAKSTTKNAVIKLPVLKACPEIAGDISARFKACKGAGDYLYFKNIGRDDHSVEKFVHHFGATIFALWERKFPGTKPKLVKSLRHTRTTEWIEAGVEPDIIGTWLGHVDGSKMVLAIYAHRKAVRSFKASEAV